jgi:hypothetical protein
MIKPGSPLDQYLSAQQRVLAGDGEFLVKDSEEHVNEEPTDYSYLVFPFAKMYEGFLKQLFLDLGVIEEGMYYSDRFRIGKALSPNYSQYAGSVYGQMEKRYGKSLATRLWNMWKEGRNLVFHYFPHNYRALTRAQAIDLVEQLVQTMEEAVEITGVKPKKREDVCFVGRGQASKTMKEITELAKK